MATVTKIIANTELFTLPTLSAVKKRVNEWASSNLQYAYKIGVDFVTTPEDDFHTLVFHCLSEDDAALCRMRW